MLITDITPKQNEIVNLTIVSSYLLASLSPAGTMMLSAGILPEGCMSVKFDLPNTDYGHEMKEAVIQAVETVNNKFPQPTMRTNISLLHRSS